MFSKSKANTKKGFGLIELLVAITIFTIAMLGIIPLLVNFMRTNVENEIRNNANAVAQQTIDELKGMNLNLIDNGTDDKIYNEWPYNVKWEVIKDNASFNVDINLVKITVTWSKPYKGDNETLQTDVILGK
jgi:prepilin-type N-terminal cleavage/methylation domain-containing protein